MVVYGMQPKQPSIRAISASAGTVLIHPNFIGLPVLPVPQMPAKHEHVVYCRLSKRQRKLYEEYMAASDVSFTLSDIRFPCLTSIFCVA